uniref:Uncharacterized protein n=1 Tax=Tanacetum cinerariifolium TaxID=118510 RepID=A0A699HW81_TANCI|nr:hypothetical protein [Tanacetum cinerariifolium]
MMNVETILNDNLGVTEQSGKCSSPGKDTDVAGEKISKNGSDYDITIAKSSHDKDKTKLLRRHMAFSGSYLVDSPEQIRLTNFYQQEVKPILHNLHLNLEIFQKRLSKDIKEMMDVFDSMESYLDKTLKQNEHLKDRLLEATLAEDVKNRVITSCVEIGNKKLQDEIERFSKASKDVLNESQTADTCCNDAFDVTKELSKRIVDWEKDFSKLEA